METGKKYVNIPLYIYKFLWVKPKCGTDINVTLHLLCFCKNPASVWFSDLKQNPEQHNLRHLKFLLTLNNELIPLNETAEQLPSPTPLLP